MLKNFLKKHQENGPAGRKNTERVTGLGRRTREEIVKWNQMTVMRFETGGRHQTSQDCLQGVLTVKLAEIQVCTESKAS